MFSQQSLLVEDQTILDAQRKEIQAANITDTRSAPALERILTLKQAEVDGDKASQRSAENEAEELLTLVDAASKARDQLAKCGGQSYELAKVDKKISSLRSRLDAARDTAERSARIAKARTESLNKWLAESILGVTNREFIELARKRDKALAAL